MASKRQEIKETVAELVKDASAAGTNGNGAQDNGLEEEVKKRLQEEKAVKARMQNAAREIQAICDKYQVDLDGQMVMTSKGNQFNLMIVPRQARQ